MRKMQQQQALEFVKLLEQAHNELKDLMLKKEYETARSLLADCQEGAIEVGHLIEKAEGEQCVTVSMIEEYCEQIYLIHEKLAQGEGVNADKAYKMLHRQVIKIANSIKNDIPTRKEIVFLPYKASMWDSLESVWRVADEDELCDAYVIPIPYYDKNPDGSFKEMHYEGDQYPEYVPVTNYEEYDFENRKPDMIFIHNPYDEFNYVTNVPPFFYAKNLKKFTERLVYIPYFILKEISPDNDQAVKGMEHFCTVPGVLYADRVIVQSEDMRTIYINVLTETFGEETRQTWERKILGLGSPKLDKVSNTSKNGVEIPEEWLRVIRKPDGGAKKIILYNTSINTLLKHEEKMLVKMHDVFKTFKENKDEIALLWRPHPLIKSTISSMRPALWEAYEKMIKQYKEEGWGIYDDTAELDRAIVMSDGYYGDESSVVQLCQKVGKPVMIQNVKIIEN